MRASILNLFQPGGVTPVASPAAHTSYPVTNLKYPERQLILWKSTSLVQQTIVWPLGAVTNGPMLLVLPNANFSTIVLEGNNADVWTSPPFTQTLFFVWHHVSGRAATGLYLPLGFPYTFARLRIPAQATLDGTTAFALGGAHLGPILLTPPSGVLADFTIGPAQSPRFVPSDNMSLEDYIYDGPRRVQITVSRRARVANARPGSGSDDLWIWQGFDASVLGYPFAVIMSDQDPYKAWIVRQVTDEIGWAREQGNMRVMKSTMTLRETIGP